VQDACKFGVNIIVDLLTRWDDLKSAPRLIARGDRSGAARAGIPRIRGENRKHGAVP